jgi:apolipoprotein N-acyltransferase
MIKYPSINIRLWLLPALSGLFIGTSYIPFPPWASLFCFIPLWIFWRQQTKFINVFLGGLLTAFIFTLIGFNWVTYMLHEFAHLNWPVSVFGMLFYALIAHLFVPVAGSLWFLGQTKFQWHESVSLGLMTLITILSEAYSFTLFDWNFGYTWYGADIPIYHWAELIGFSGLSALTLLCNLPLYIAWQKRQMRSGKIILALVIGVFISMNFIGLKLKARLPQPDATLKVLLVQASIDNAEKLATELGAHYGNAILNRYLDLTNKALDNNLNEKIDFAMWPETAFPSFLGEKFKLDENPQTLAQFLKSRQLPLITGAYGVDETKKLITNSMFILDKNGEIFPTHYSKTRLLAFGEYIPGEQYFPEIRQWLPPTGHFARGFGPTQLLEWNNFKMGAQICYESLFPEFTRALAILGAQFIVNVTNDSWYGAWQEPYQHMYMTLARGVEFRRPVLRVTNTGISTVSLASGEILQRSPINQPWTGIYNVAYLKNPPTTFYQRWFWLIPSLLWGSLVILLIAGVFKRDKS